MNTKSNSKFAIAAHNLGLSDLPYSPYELCSNPLPVPTQDRDSPRALRRAIKAKHLAAKRRVVKGMKSVSHTRTAYQTDRDRCGKLSSEGIEMACLNEKAVESFDWCTDWEEA